MRNFKLTLEYDGVQFKGWQIQKNGERTVQGELEKACAVIFKQPTRVIASGRTDSGVHAKGQVASFKADTRMKPVEIQKALNSKLPPDVAVIKTQEVADDFHAQYSVKEKTYRYTILNRTFRSAFLRAHAYFYPYPLNTTKMRKAAKFLVGRHDFKSFQAYDPLRADRDTVRTIKKIAIKKEGELLHIEVTANGFLYKMVRNIAGTLISVGGCHTEVTEVPKILKAKDRNQSPDTAPAHGLTLISVKY
jgi:tRNA pseudouridine38-40 synthase